MHETTRVTAIDLSQTLGCSELVAQELLTTGQAVASGFRELADTWTFDLMLESKRAVIKQEKLSWAAYGRLPRDQKHKWDQKAEDTKRVRKSHRSLSRDARKMFDAFAKTHAAWQTFRLARNRVPDLRGKSNEELLTAVFETAHTSLDLYEPEKIIEGRCLYEAMLRDRRLLCDVGILTD